MFLSPDDDDDEDFNASKSSKLAGIFRKSEEMDDASLKYTAPKQPKKASGNDTNSNNGAKSSNQLSLIHSSPVNVFKLEDGKSYVHQGKLGLAILGDYNTCDFLLLMYKDKKNTITKATIKRHFVYTVQDNNYATFYDDQRQNWSVNFENAQLSVQFATQIAVAKYNSGDPRLESVIVQDISLGSGPSILSGESISVAYVGWKLTDHKIGSVYCEGGKARALKYGESSLFNGFDSGLLNMKYGGHRLVITQSHVDKGSIQSEIEIPENFTLVFRLEIEEKSSPSHDKPSIPSKPSVNPVLEDASIKARGASISEQLQGSPKTDKAKLISRIAKMGQPVVPYPSKVVSSESEAEEAADVQQPVPNPRHKPKHRPNELHDGENVSSSLPHLSNRSVPTLPSYTNTSNFLPGQPLSLCSPQQFMGPSHAVMPVAASATAPYVLMSGQPSTFDSHIPALLSEVRAQNTEIRMQMSQVLDRIDKVGHNVVYPNMEVGVLGENINRIFQQNETLKKSLNEKEAKIESLTEKVNELLQSNQRVLEKNNSMLEERSGFILQSSSTEKLSALQKEKSQLLEELESAKKVNSKLSEKARELETLEDKLKANLEKLFHVESARDKNEKMYKDCLNQVENLTERLKEKDVNLRELQEMLSKLEKNDSKSEEMTLLVTENRRLNNEISHLMQSFRDLEQKLEREKEKNIKESTPKESSNQQPIVEEIKKVMNAVYRSLQKEFVITNNYTGEDIKSTLASSIRQITLEIMEKYTERDKNPPQVQVVATITESRMKPPEEAKAEREEEMSEQKSKSPAIDKTEGVEQKAENERKPKEEPQIEPWRPQPPPFFDEPDSDDDWLNSC